MPYEFQEILFASFVLQVALSLAWLIVAFLEATPISLGAVYGEVLETKYHGWQYDVNGVLVRIPTISVDECAMKKLALYAYPCIEIYDRIWVWPGEANLADQDAIPEIFKFNKSGEWRHMFDQIWDVDVDPLLVMENMSDLSHYYFAHDKVLAQRKDAHIAPMTLREVDLATIAGSHHSGKKAHSISVQVPGGGDTFEQLFYGPCHITSTKREYGKPVLMIVFHIIPISNNHVRVMTSDFAFIGSSMDKMCKFPGFKSLVYFVSDLGFFQDYRILASQQLNVHKGAHSLKTQVHCDGLSNVVKSYVEKELKVVYPDIIQDYYSLHLNKFWFGGWSCLDGVEEPLKHSTSGCSLDNQDSDYIPPKQKYVNRTAYTKLRKQNNK